MLRIFVGIYFILLYSVQGVGIFFLSFTKLTIFFLLNVYSPLLTFMYIVIMTLKHCPP